MSVVDVAVATHRLLTEQELTHGFGGALALNFYADPRSTADVDVNVFVPWAEGLPLIGLFESIGYLPVKPPAEALPVSGIRLAREGTRIVLDVFFSLDAVYDEVAERLQWFPFGYDGEELPFFSAEDVVVFKLSFNRDKDWVDIRHLLEHQRTIELDYIERQLLAMRGPSMHPRVARVRAMARTAGIV